MYYYNYHENLIDNYLFPFRQLDLGNIWHEKNGVWHGIWQRRGNSNIFDARWTKPFSSDSVTAVMEVQVNGNQVRVRRTNSSDGNNCYLTGTISLDGRTVIGNYNCNHGSGHWEATIHHSSQIPQLGNYWIQEAGRWRGVWQRRGNSNIFDARWTMSGTTESVTAVLEMFLTGNNVHIIRRYSSDGNDCQMTGTIAQGGRSVSGTSQCNHGGGNWNATIHY